MQITHKNIEAKDFRAFIRKCSVFKSEQLSANIKLTFRKALIRSAMTYASPTWEFVADTNLLKIAVSAKHWHFSKAHIGP
jgi:uncharacterized protein YdhG (YjbR/CyaY superfamily)